MMKKMKATDIMKMFEKQNVVNRADFTFGEYIKQLTSFEKIVSSCVFDGDSSFRLSDSISQLSQFVRSKNLQDNTFVHDCLKCLKNVNKELSICMAGKRGEKRIEKMLSFVQRPDLTVYKNVYITDGEEETEMDMVLVTANGIIILEVKNAKQDITIAEDGRLLYENEISYHNVSIGDKMEKKRRLLRYRIEQEMKSRGIEFFCKPIRIESRVVFSTPYKMRITVTDLYKKERFCYKSQLNKQVENYFSGTCYDGEDLQVLNDIIGSIESNKKRFQQKLDFAKINSGFAQLMEMLSTPDVVETVEASPSSSKKTIEENVSTSTPVRRKTKHHSFGKIAIPAGSVALLLASVISGAIISRKQ